MALLTFPSGAKHRVKCPSCGSETNFSLAVSTIIPVWDSIPAIPQFQGFAASSHSEIACRSCGHEGSVQDFAPQRAKQST